MKSYQRMILLFFLSFYLLTKTIKRFKFRYHIIFFPTCCIVSAQYSAVHNTLHDRHISDSFNLVIVSPSFNIDGIFGKFCINIVAVPTKVDAVVFVLFKKNKINVNK